MHQAGRHLTALKYSPTSIADSMRPNADKLKSARTAAEKLLSSYPESGRENHGYVVRLVEAIAWLTQAEIDEVMHPRTGLATVCKYLPTPADIHGFLKARRAERERFLPAPSAWPAFTHDEPPAGWQPDPERRKAFIRATLGYNPATRRGTVGLADAVPIGDIPASATALRSPARPVSDELKALLTTQGYGHLIAGPAHG